MEMYSIASERYTINVCVVLHELRHANLLGTLIPWLPMGPNELTALNNCEEEVQDLIIYLIKFQRINRIYGIV